MNHPTDEQIDRAADVLAEIKRKAMSAMPLPVLDVGRHFPTNNEAGLTIFSISLNASEVPDAPGNEATVYLTFKRDEDVKDPATVDHKIDIAARVVRNRILPSALAHEHRG